MSACVCLVGGEGEHSCGMTVKRVPHSLLYSWNACMHVLPTNLRVACVFPVIFYVGLFTSFIHGDTGDTACGEKGDGRDDEKLEVTYRKLTGSPVLHFATAKKKRGHDSVLN